MSCEVVPFEGGVGILCARGAKKPIDWIPAKCLECGKRASFQCDFQIAMITPGGITCARWMCLDHAHKVGKNKDYCPEHIAKYREYLAK